MKNVTPIEWGNGVEFTPIGYGLGYCIGKNQDDQTKHVYYFNGYPSIEYKDCVVIKLDDADVDSFVSDTIMDEGRDCNNKYFRGIKVVKCKGIALSQDWVFVPGVGIKCDATELRFGMNRGDIRAILGNEQEFNFCRGYYEDSYEKFQNTDTWFRLFYSQSNILTEIEFLLGEIFYNDVALIGGNWSTKKIVRKLKSHGFSFRKDKDNDGWISEDMNLNLCSSKDMGGDGNNCTYLYSSSDMSHLATIL